MLSDVPLKIAFRNFFRNKMVNLSARSIKHFLPNAEIHCFTLFKESMKEYNEQEKLLPYIVEHRLQTKYVNPNNEAVQDHIDSTKTSGYANPDNGLYFAEGFNLIYNYFKGLDAPVVILAEDHFFTTGKVLSELISNDYDVAIAPGDSEHNANGALIVINPAKVANYFPVQEYRVPIESLISETVMKNVPPERLYRIKNRKWIDYCGDGIYTNSSDEMIMELQKAGIL